MKLFNKTVDVYWTPTGGLRSNDPFTWQQMAWPDPESALKRIKNQRNALYLKCPAFQDYYKNTYVVKSPVDFSLKVEKNIQGKKLIASYAPDVKSRQEDFYKNYIMDRNIENDTFSTLSVSFDFLFYSKESVIMELIPANLETDTKNNLDNLRIITGQYDISKWFRPISFTAEIKDDLIPITFKRNDAMYYVRFITKNNQKVNLIRSEYTPELKNLVSSCLDIKFFITKNSLEENYTMAESFIKLIKNKIFPKKCPFGFKK